MRRAILWLNSREPIDWFLYVVCALGGVALLFCLAGITGCIRGHCQKPQWSDLGVLLVVAAALVIGVVLWTFAWRRAVAWAEGRLARAPETLTAPDPFAEAARREVEELTRES